MSLSERPQNVNPSHLWIACIAAAHKREISYMEKPNSCSRIGCETLLPYSKRNNKFCSTSCSAKENNAFRDPSIKTGPERTKFPFTRVTLRNCKSCNKFFRLTRSGVQYCSDYCKNKLCSTNIKSYRRACKFLLNKKDHSILFDSNLIKQFGWYSPSNKGNNLQGVCWDHLYRIEEGFKNKVPISILNHPANAELVPWPVNTRRRSSQITLDELKARIEKWDRGDINLPRYYHP